MLTPKIVGMSRSAVQFTLCQAITKREEGVENRSENPRHLKLLTNQIKNEVLSRIAPSSPPFPLLHLLPGYYWETDSSFHDALLTQGH